MTPTLLQRLRWLTASAQDIAADELRQRSAVTGATPVRECCTGEVMTVTGTLSSVTLRPKQGLKALEAELFDGTGTVTLIWLGRRSITGITPGRNLSVSGRLVDSQGRLAIYNPRYTLLAKVDG